MHMKPYILLTPGPLTTSQTVKEAMLTDWCTWDEDYNLHIVEEIRKSLVSLATQHTGDYTSILLQGSGTYCVEAVIGSVIKPGDKLLILSNGAYGDRMGNIAEYHGISYDMLAFDETEQVSVSYVDDYLSHNAEITHVAVVHCETTTGVLNPLKEIAHLVKMHGKKLIVDAMSSFGGVPLDVHELGIDFLISSANKCIQAFRDLASSSPAVPSCCTARASPSHSLSTFTTNGKPWRKDMANGVLLLPHTWSAPSSKPWTNWQRRAVWRPVTTDIARTTACWWTACVPSVSKRCCRTRFNRPLLLLSSILMPISTSKLSTHN